MASQRRLLRVRTGPARNRQRHFQRAQRRILVFDGNARYALTLIGANLPKFAANNRAAGTADENKAVVAGSLAHFGTYAVDEANKSGHPIATGYTHCIPDGMPTMMMAMFPMEVLQTPGQTMDSFDWPS